MWGEGEVCEPLSRHFLALIGGASPSMAISDAPSGGEAEPSHASRCKRQEGVHAYDSPLYVQHPTADPCSTRNFSRNLKVKVK